MAYQDLPPSPHYGEEHAALRDTVRRFVDAELMPHVAAWEEAKSFPRALYRRAGELGLLGIGYPEEYGGTRRTCSRRSS